MRVLIPGMGGEVATRVARRLEGDDRVEAICGFDLEPPRRWMRRAEFHWVRPAEAARVAQIVADFEPTVVTHLWAFEPHSRSTPVEARARTIAGAASVFDAIDAVGGVEHIVLRSGLEVYGRRGRDGEPPTTESPVQPTCRFGRLLRHIEARAEVSASESGATVCPVRLAPIAGAHMPSPLARYLRLPAVPLPLRYQPFSLIHHDDAAAVLAAATTASIDGPINASPDDSITVFDAIRVGRRLPIPVVGPALRWAAIGTEFLGSPLAEHSIELIRHGRVAEPSPLHDLLGVRLEHSTASTLADLYGWGASEELQADLVFDYETGTA